MIITVDRVVHPTVYEGQNKGVNFVGRAILKLANQKSNQDVVIEFM